MSSVTPPSSPPPSTSPSYVVLFHTYPIPHATCACHLNRRNPLKRKAPPDDTASSSPSQAESQTDINTLPGSASLPEGEGEYSSGQVVCDFCGANVPFRDERTDRFTTKIWDDHRITWFVWAPFYTIYLCVLIFRTPINSGAQPAPAPALSSSVLPLPTMTPSSFSNQTHPPPKRRRAKRTEEERIKYLRADPYVAQFEAYRVLCASCDKWIRLRPNSTYCSIPWDAHRKGCLTKKMYVLLHTHSQYPTNTR